MSENHRPQLAGSGDDAAYKKESEKNVPGREQSLDDRSIAKGEDLLAQQDLDPSLNAKMFIVNNVSWLASI